ncbi:7812_t:CDS:1, partial [Cetraspora pellucida]
MNKCTSCNNHYLPESFKYKGKVYKTCANCLTSKAEKRRKLNNENTQSTMETISAQSLCNYIENLISNIENNNGISFEIRIDLDDDIFSEVKSDNLKSIARIIVDKVEEGNDYIWSTSTASHTSVRFDNVATYYFACSQCYKLEREFKQSNRKQITRFDCHGKLTLHIDVPAIEAILKLRHDIIHKKSEDVSMPEEIKQEIRANLHLDPIQIRAILHSKFEILNITAKQIHYWWLAFVQDSYKLDDDQ